VIRPRENSPIRVLVADDHPLIHRGLVAMMRGTRYAIEGWVPDGALFLDAVKDQDPDLIVLDDMLPSRKGLDLFRDLRSAGDERPVVLLSGHLSLRRALEAIEASVNGLILKDRPEKLVECLDQVLQGERWFDDDLMGHLLCDRAGHSRASEIERLTERERDLVQLATAGLSWQEIADRLKTSHVTVRVHFHNIYRKLDLRDRTDLLLYVDRQW
jgi:two-component system nitrate/nitrite response regulator NarL